MEEHLKKAIQYVRENKTWTEAQETRALEVIDHYRCNIQQADSGISDEIRTLMDEYGEENNLPEDWWREFGDEDNIFMIEL